VIKTEQFTFDANHEIFAGRQQLRPKIETGWISQYVSLLPLIEDLHEVPGFVFNSGLIRPWWSFIYSAVTLVRSGWVSVAFPLLLAGVSHTPTAAILAV